MTINVNKQEQFTPPYGREPSELLALTLNILPVFDRRETRAESSNPKKLVERDGTHAERRDRRAG